MAYCPDCGSGISDEMSFCPNCGQNIPRPVPPRTLRKAKKDRGLLILGILAIAVVVVVVLALFALEYAPPAPDYYPPNGIFTKDPREMIVNSSDFSGYNQLDEVSGDSTPGFHDGIYVKSWAESRVGTKDGNGEDVIIEVTLYLLNSSEEAEISFSDMKFQNEQVTFLADLYINNGSFMTTRNTTTNWYYEGTVYRGNMLLIVTLITAFDNTTFLHSAKSMKEIMNIQLTKLADMNA